MGMVLPPRRFPIRPHTPMPTTATAMSTSPSAEMHDWHGHGAPAEVLSHPVPQPHDYAACNVC
eukprot:363696-Chlamydomonas_euryale.AAC.20